MARIIPAYATLRAEDGCAREIETAEQLVQLLDTGDNRPVRGFGRRFEAFGLQSLEPETEAVALPVQDLQPVAGLIERDEKHRIEYRHFYIQFDQRGEAIDGFRKSTDLG